MQSDKHNRALLLEKITGSKEFRKIGIKAFKAYNKRRKEIEVISEAINMNRENLLGEEERQELAETIKSADERSTQLHALLESANHKLVQKQRIAKLKLELNEKQGVLKIAREKLNKFN